MKQAALALAFAACLPAQVLGAQDVAARLQSRVPASVIRAVQQIAADAKARGLPSEPLIQKALEGGAKGVPAERVIEAIRVLVARLETARAALRDAGITNPSAEALEGGAYALNVGLTAQQVRDLGRMSRAPYEPTLTLRVAATLTVLGVPAPKGVQLIRHMIQAGRAPAELLDLPGEVQLGVARGASPAQAAEAVENGNQNNMQEGQQGNEGQEGRSRPHRP
jgi:hypothetical protein